MGEAAARRREDTLDWLRGVAVLIMIEAHTLDAWTRPADRASDVYKWAVIIGGMGAPLFLLLAGLSSVLAATSRAAALGSDAAAAATVRRRGGRIFLYAFLFRLQSLALNPGAALSSLLKVDILNIMGPSIVGTALLWQAVRGWTSRLLLFGAVTAAIAMVTPLVRASPWVHALPDPVEWYLRPVPGRTNFTLLPWAGFVTAGAAVGVCLSRTAPGGGSRTMAALGAAGLATALAGYFAVVPAAALPADELLDQLADVLLPSRRRAGIVNRRGVGLGTPGATRGMESASHPRPRVAVRVLDPRGDGLRRADVAAPPPPAAAVGPRGVSGVHRSDARRRGDQAPGGGPAPQAATTCRHALSKWSGNS